MFFLQVNRSTLSCPLCRTRLYFCNIPIKTTDSHIFFYLKRSKNSHFDFLPPNKLSSSQLACHICNLTNVFKLSLIERKNSSEYRFICEDCSQNSEISNLIPIMKGKNINEYFLSQPQFDLIFIQKNLKPFSQQQMKMKEEKI
jgi:uncharacterized protein YbaR (Trm112 family)